MKEYGRGAGAAISEVLALERFPCHPINLPPPISLFFNLLSSFFSIFCADDFAPLPPAGAVSSRSSGESRTRPLRLRIGFMSSKCAISLFLTTPSVAVVVVGSGFLFCHSSSAGAH